MRIVNGVAIFIGTLFMLAACLGCSGSNPYAVTSTSYAMDERSTPTVNVTQIVEAKATANAEVARKNEADRKAAIVEYTPEPTATPEPDKIATREAVFAERTPEAETSADDMKAREFQQRANGLARAHKASFTDLNDLLPRSSAHRYLEEISRDRAEKLVIRAWDVCQEVFVLSQDVGAVKSQTDSMVKVSSRVALMDHSCRSDDGSDVREMPIRVLITVVMRLYDLRTWDEEPPTELSHEEWNPGPQEFYLDYATLMGEHPEAFDINNGNFLVYLHGRIVEIFNVFSKEQPIYMYRISLFGRDDEMVIGETMGDGSLGRNCRLPGGFDFCPYFPQVGDLVQILADVGGKYEYVSMKKGDPQVGDRLMMEMQMGLYDDLPGDEYAFPGLMIWEMSRIHQMHNPDAILYEYRFEGGEWSTLSQP